MDLRRLINIADVERAAKRRLPKPVFDAISGGAGDERTLGWNRQAFDRWQLLPTTLVDVRERDLSVEVFGDRLSLPVLTSPTGFQRMAHREAELATARAAGAAGTGFILSTATSYTLEDVAAVATGPKWFQLYKQGERPDAEKLVERAKAAGFGVLVVTVDTAMHAMRERDLRNRLTIPMKMHPKTVAAAAIRPAWSMDFLRGGVGRGLRTTKRTPMSLKDAGIAIAKTGRTVTYDDIAWMRESWPGPLVVKGILNRADVPKLIDHGVDGVIVSNHGGRQLDTAPPTIDVLPGIVDEADGRIDVFMDGGVRRGFDIVKALALGAKAVMVGRPFLWGLGAGGQAGVERVLEILRHEIDGAIGLLGCPNVRDLDRTYVQRACPHCAHHAV